MFQLDPILNKDCIILGQFELSLLLLMNDANYPWCILVPQRAEMSEIYQLSATDQQQLMVESSLLARTLDETFHADKINIAALGNVVNQLHIHHVARYRNDASWPAPIWGKQPAIPYTAEELALVSSQLVQALGEQFTPSQP